MQLKRNFEVMIQRLSLSLSNECYVLCSLFTPIQMLKGVMVKKRFLNMKDTFMDNHRKIKESKQRCSGKSPDEIYTPKWSMYNHLLFLLKTVAQAESFTNLDPSYESQYESAPTSLTLMEETQEDTQQLMYYDENLQVINDVILFIFQ